MAIGSTLYRKILGAFGNGPGTELATILNNAGADGTYELPMLVGETPATAGSYAFGVAGDETGDASVNNYGGFVNMNLTNASGQNAFHLGVVPEGTTTGGSVTIVASMLVAEPIITVASGSIALACTMYIASAPTEGAGNYALYVSAGKSHVGGALSLGDSGTVTASGTGGTSTATLSKQTGVITTDAITTAAGAAHVITVTNTLVAATSKILVTLDKNGSTGRPVVTSVTPGSSSFTVEITNIHASAAVNAALKVHFLVLNAT